MPGRRPPRAAGRASGATTGFPAGTRPPSHEFRGPVWAHTSGALRVEARRAQISETLIQLEASDFRVFHFPERNPILIAQRTLHDLVEFVWLAVRYQILLKDYAPLHPSLYFSQSVLNRQAKMHQFDGLELPASADFHVHLREGDVMEAVTPTIRQGGVIGLRARAPRV